MGAGGNDEFVLIIYHICVRTSLCSFFLLDSGTLGLLRPLQCWGMYDKAVTVVLEEMDFVLANSLDCNM